MGPEQDRRARVQLENELLFNERNHESRTPLIRATDESQDVQRPDSGLSVQSNISDFSTGSNVENSWLNGSV